MAPVKVLSVMGPEWPALGRNDETAMTQPTTPSTSSGLVRVTVASGSRRIDLVLPGAVPVAELAPELARGVGLLDAATVHGGYYLVAPDGRRLAGRPD